LDGLGHVLRLDPLARFEIRNRARDPQDPVVGASRKTQPRDCILHQLLTFPIQFAKTTKRARGHLGVAENAERLETARLALPRSQDALPDGRRFFALLVLGQFFVFHGRNLDMQIDSVEQRTGDARKVTLDQGRRAIAFAGGLRKSRKGVDSNFGAEREIEINLEGPYRRVPAARLNKFGLPEKSHYRTRDVCAALGISSDLLRWRFLRGKYSEVRRDARGRLFTLDDLEAILAQTKNL